jgi:hypothetical protein
MFSLEILAFVANKAIRELAFYLHSRPALAMFIPYFLHFVALH